MAIYKTQNNTYVIGSPCYKCGGSGYIREFSATHNGLCYACKGANIIRRGTKSFATVAEAQAHEAKLDAEEAKREAKRQAEYQANLAANLAAYAEREAEDARRQAAIAAANAEYKTLDAQIGDVVTVSGIVKTAVSIDGNYGPQMLIVIETPNRELVKAYTAANWAFCVERDEALTITAEVANFSEYENKAQTQVRKPKKVA